MIKSKSYSLDETDIERIAQAASEAGVSDSHVLRMALEHGLAGAEARLKALHAPIASMADLEARRKAAK